MTVRAYPVPLFSVVSSLWVGATEAIGVMHGASRRALALPIVVAAPACPRIALAAMAWPAALRGVSS